MADDIPADWYPDAHGTIRWWDGARWTDHVRGEVHADAPTAKSKPAASDESANSQTAVLSSVPATGLTAPRPVNAGTTTGPSAAPQSNVTSRVIYPVNPESDDKVEDDEPSATRRIVLTATAVGLAAFFLGMGIGSRTQAPQAVPSAEPTPVVVTDSPELDQRAADLDERQSELDDRQDELDKRTTELDARKAELDARASAIPTPTPTPTATATATATTIGGDSTVLVGTDVVAGSYRTTGPSDPAFECEYTVSSDSNGDNVITTDSTSSAASVSLQAGQYFETDDCADWTKE